MRSTLMLALFPILAAVAPAAAEQRSFDLSGFTTVGLGGADRVMVTLGQGYSVRAEGLPADLAELKVERRGDAIDIGRQKNAWQRRGAKAVTVFVTLPRIYGANVGGSGSMQIDRVEAKEFEANVGGSGSIAIGRVSADTLTANIGGSGSVRAAGAARQLDVSIGGSGEFAGAGLASAGADVTLAGSGSVRTMVNGQADVTITGSGSINLGPRSRCSVTKIGSGQVACGSRG